MKDLSVALKAHLALGSTTMALCWKATLTNGTVVTATAHDRDIVFDGLTYLASAAYTPSDVESGSDLAPDNLEVEGFLASPHIVAADLHTGIWDYAAIEIFEVNYRDLTMGRNLIRSGTLGEVKAGLASFRAELRGLMQAYSRKIVRIIQAICDADLGDARCTVDLAPFTVSGIVEAVSENRLIACESLREPLNWYTGGKITFTSGDNSALGDAGADLSMEVKRSAGSQLTLHEMMPFTIAVGDTFSVYAGCQKRLSEDCIAKFNNVVNFRGFPHLPGSRVYSGPASGLEAPTAAPAPSAPVPAPPAPAPAPYSAPGPTTDPGTTDPGPAPAPAPSSTDSDGDATIIALIGGGGGVVSIPGGITYTIDAPITVPAGTTLQPASGTAVTLKAANGYSGNILVLGTGSTIQDLTIDGNYANRSAEEGVTASAAISISGGTGITIQNVKFLNTPSFAVWAYNTNDLSILYNEFVETYHAIRFDGNDLSGSGSIVGNVVTNTSAFKSIQHFEILNTNGITLQYNTLSGAGLLEPTSHGFEGTWGNSIYLWNSDSFTVEDNTAGDNYWSAMVAGAGATNGTIQRNEFNDGTNSPQALWIEQAGAAYVTVDLNILGGGINCGDTGGDHLTITNNEIRSLEMGINVNSAAKDVLIQSNRIYSQNGTPTSTGIYLWEKSDPATDTQVLDNHIEGFDKGIDINRSGGVGTVYGITVTGNTFTGNNTNISIPGGITLDASCTIQTVYSPPAPAPAPSITVASWPNTILQTGNDDDAYWMQDNRWGQGSIVEGSAVDQFEQKVGVSSTIGSNGEVAYRMQWRWPNPVGSNEVKGYPAILYGKKPGIYNTGPTPGGLTVRLLDGTNSLTAPSGPTPGTFLPLQLPLASLKVNANFDDVSAAPTGAGHLSYDIWLQSSSTQDHGFTSSSITHEIMIPLTYWGGYGEYPSGRNPDWYSHDVTIGGVLFHVYCSMSAAGVLDYNFGYLDGTYGRSGWKFIVFEPDSADLPITGELDIAAIIAHAASRVDSAATPWLAGNEWVSSIELGVEPNEGSGDIVVSDFKVYT